MKRATWEPGWYFGDQSIALRLTDEFVFWEARPPGLEAERLVLYDGDFREGELMVGHGTISRIWHPQLGEIREIDTGGDNYRVYLANGTVFGVDQEQNPGWIGDAWAFDADGKAQPQRAPGVQWWRVDVEFESLSALRPVVDLPAWQASRRRGERRMTIEELSQRHGVAVAPLVAAAVALGLDDTTSEPLLAEDVYVIEAQLGLNRA